MKSKEEIKVTIAWGTDKRVSKTYTFESEELKEAFMQGVNECDGWWEHEVKNE